MASRKQRDLTKGSIEKEYILFAIPLFLGSLFQQLYSTVDLMFAGRIIGKEAAAAIGASGIIITCLIGLFSGIAVGTGIVVSNAVGANNKNEVSSIIRTAILGSVLGGFLLMIFGQIIIKTALLALGTPETLMQSAVEYVRIYFLAMIPMILYNMCSAIFRAQGNSKTPFYILAVGGVLNVCMDTLFVGVLKWGVSGAAIATCISQLFTAAVSVYLLRAYLKILELKMNLFVRIIQLGVPIGIQSMLITFSNIFVQYVINSFGEDTVAAFAVYFKAENLVYLPIMAMGQAMVTFTSQNYGASEYKRIRKGIFTCNMISITVTFIIGMCGYFAGETLLRVFCEDEAVIFVGLRIIRITFPFYFIYSILELTGSVIRGLGRTFQSMIIILTNLCALRILMLLFVYARIHTLESVVAVYPITWCTTALSFIGYYIFLTYRRKSSILPCTTRSRQEV